MKITYGVINIPVDVEPKLKMISIILTGTDDEVAFALREIEKTIHSGCNPEPHPHNDEQPQDHAESSDLEASSKVYESEVSG